MEINATLLLKDSAVLIGQCLAQLPSERLPPTVDKNKYRGPQLDNVQRIKDLKILSPT